MNLLGEKELAEYLGVRHETVWRWRKRKIENLSYIKIGGRYFYHPDDIENFIRKNRVKPDALTRGAA
jgi:hypothetical protein